MRNAFRPRLFERHPDGADTEFETTLPPVGSNPLEGYWLPILPQPSEPQAPKPQAIQAKVVEVEMVGAAEHDGFNAITSTSTARLSAVSSPVATRTTYTSGAPGAYNITLQFKGSWTVAMQNVFIGAANRISATIIGDLPNVKVGSQVVDDIIISAELKSIDGAGGVLAKAGPTTLRVGSFLPATATMRFDTADTASFHAQGLLDEIVTHEMLHAVGFGSIWSHKALLTGAGFIGKNAVAEYNKLVDAHAASHDGSTRLANGTQLTKGAVPVETEGGPGTAKSHWAEAVFDTELMTGWLDSEKPSAAMASNPLSALTVASLRDLSYMVATRAPSDMFYLG